MKYLFIPIHYTLIHGDKEFKTMFSRTIFSNISGGEPLVPSFAWGVFHTLQYCTPPPKPESWIFPGFTYNTMWPINTRRLLNSSGSLTIDELTSLL